jgi:hypothetical protein
MMTRVCVSRFFYDHTYPRDMAAHLSYYERHIDGRRPMSITASVRYQSSTLSAVTQRLRRPHTCSKLRARLQNVTLLPKS